jgi:hypothetical protein
MEKRLSHSNTLFFLFFFTPNIGVGVNMNKLERIYNYEGVLLETRRIQIEDTFSYFMFD